MLLLGIPFHSSEIYRVSGGFSIASPDTTYVASMISGLVHVFRMPSFFMLSGFFAAMLLQRRDPMDWLGKRFWKLGIPLVCTTLLLGPIENGLVYSFNHQVSLIEGVDAARQMSLYKWVNHRWFLVVLLLYCTTTVLLLRLKAPIGGSDVAKLPKNAAGKVVSIAGLVAIPFVAILAGKFWGEWLVVSPALKQYANLYVKYAAFFAIGYALYATRGGLDGFLAYARSDVAITIIAVGLYMATYFAFYPGRGGVAALPSGFGIVRIGIEVVAGYYAAKTFFWVMRRFMNARSATMAYVVEASFCVYLVHWGFLLAAGGFLLQWHLPAVVEIVLITGWTLAASLATFEVVRRIPLLCVLFNGGPVKPLARPATP